MKKKGLKKRRAARKNYEKVAKTSKVGKGKRFAALEKSAKASGASNPAGVAATAGRAKYGTKKMTSMAVAAKKRKKK